jgi:hypothetical protein
MLEADGGTLTVNSPVTGGGNAVIVGGTLDFSGAADNNVSFSGRNAGVLALDQSLHQPDPALRIGIQVPAVRRQRQRFNLQMR